MPKTFTDGELLTAEDINTHLNHGLIGWTAYTPAWTALTTNPDLGNGTLEGWYTRIGDTIIGRIHLTYGSTTTIGSGAYSFGVPTAAVSSAQVPVGSSRLRDNSAPAYAMRTAYLNTSTALALSAENGLNVGHNNPWTWAVGDLININFSYQAA